MFMLICFTTHHFCHVYSLHSFHSRVFEPLKFKVLRVFTFTSWLGSITYWTNYSFGIVVQHYVLVVMSKPCQNLIRQCLSFLFGRWHETQMNNFMWTRTLLHWYTVSTKSLTQTLRFRLLCISKHKNFLSKPRQSLCKKVITFQQV